MWRKVSMQLGKQSRIVKQAQLNARFYRYIDKVFAGFTRATSWKGMPILVDGSRNTGVIWSNMMDQQPKEYGPEIIRAARLSEAIIYDVHGKPMNL
jgi:hypothetical protein